MSRLQIWIESLRNVPAEGRALRIASGTMPDLWAAAPDGDAEEVRRRDELEQLRLDLAAFVYYLATVADFFMAEVPSSTAHFRAAEQDEDDGASPLDELARARVAFAINPRLAAAIVTRFRTGRGWDGHELQWRDQPAAVAD